MHLCLHTCVCKHAHLQVWVFKAFCVLACACYIRVASSITADGFFFFFFFLQQTALRAPVAPGDCRQAGRQGQERRSSEHSFHSRSIREFNMRYDCKGYMPVLLKRSRTLLGSNVWKRRAAVRKEEREGKKTDKDQTHVLYTHLRLSSHM